MALAIPIGWFQTYNVQPRLRFTNASANHTIKVICKIVLSTVVSMKLFFFGIAPTKVTHLLCNRSSFEKMCFRLIHLCAPFVQSVICNIGLQISLNYIFMTCHIVPLKSGRKVKYSQKI